MTQIVKSKKIFYHPETRKISIRRLYPEQLKFDSALEFDTYCLLRKYFPEDQIACQYKIPFLSPNVHYPRGLSWTIDFVVTTNPLHNPLRRGYGIEVKGKWFKYDHSSGTDLRTKIKLVHHHYPKLWQNLCFVSDATPMKIDSHFTAISFSNLEQHLITIKEQG